MGTLSAPDQRTLEQTRQRLFRLTQSLNALQTAVITSTAPGNIPPWSTLQSNAQIFSSILSNLNSLLYPEEVQSQGQTSIQPLSDLSTFPLAATYPAAQGAILAQLLRTKAAPEVETSIENGKEEGSRVAPQVEELWEWAAGEANRIARQWNWDEENDENESDENDDDENGEKGATADEKGKGKDETWKGEPMRLEDVLRFLSTGNEPAVTS